MTGPDESNESGSDALGATTASTSTHASTANTTVSQYNPGAPGGDAGSSGQSIPSLHIPMLSASMSFGPQATATSVPTVIQLPARRTLVPWLVIAAILAIAYVFRTTLTLGFAAFAIAYVFSPLVRRVERWGVPRPAAIVLVLAGFGFKVAAVP
ncbi:MAG: hypothetical protein WCJ30_20820, partial [Deltaproteobacteria bacterium]